MLDEAATEEPVPASPPVSTENEPAAEPAKPLSRRQKSRLKASQNKPTPSTPRERREKLTKVFEDNFSDSEFAGKKAQILNILCTGTTRCDINTKLSKNLSGKEMKKLYKKFKPLLKDLPGQ